MRGKPSEYTKRKRIFRVYDSLSCFMFLAHDAKSRRKWERLLMSPQAILPLLRRFIRHYPAVVMLLACIPAALSILPPFSITWCFICLLAISLLVLYAESPKRALFLVILPAFAVTISAQISRPGIENNILATMTGHDTLKAIAKLEVTDSFASEQQSNEFQQKDLECSLISIRYSEDSEELIPPRKIKILLNLQKYNGQPLAYGDILEAEGIFRPPSDPIFPGSFNYRRYLAIQQIHEFFYPDSLTVLQKGKGPLRTLFHLRDNILAGICSNIADQNIRAVATGMLFGRKSNISRSTKDLFMHSGMIHILTVSGTHVMIVAGILLLLLSPLESKTRAICTICAVFPYVIMTGLHESSMRAFTMLAIVLLLRAFSASVNSFNSLAIAATLLLILDPASILKSGMHYSFLSVFLLLLYSKFQQTQCLKNSSDYDRCLKIRNNDTNLIIIHFRHMLSNLKQGFMTSLMISVGTSALTLLYQGYLPIQGFLANCIAIPTAMFTFIFALLTWLFHSIPFAGSICATMLSASIRLIILAGRLCVESMPVSTLATPSVFTVILFLVLFCLILLAPKSRKLPLHLAILSVIMIYWHIRPAFLPCEAAIICGGTSSESPPTLVLTKPALAHADIINLPDSNTAYAVMDYLESRGIDTCRIFAATTAQKSSFDGIEKLTEAGFPVLSALSPSNATTKMPAYPTHVVAFDKKAPFLNSFNGTFSPSESSNNTDCLLFHYNNFRGSISPSVISLEDNSGRLFFRTDIPNTSKHIFLLYEVSL